MINFLLGLLFIYFNLSVIAMVYMFVYKNDFSSPRNNLEKTIKVCFLPAIKLYKWFITPVSNEDE